jgi:hypothetical protein
MALIHEENYYTADDKFCIKFRTSKFRGSLNSELRTEVMVMPKVKNSNSYGFNAAKDFQREVLKTISGRVTKQMIQKHRDFITGCYSQIIKELKQQNIIA